MYKIIGNDLIEGVCPGNCCGGMILNGCDNDRDDKCKGDYNFTDTKPPPKWRRCFKPRLINGNVDGYDWDTSPCSEKNGEKCCGGVGRCIPSQYGGYCRATKDFTEKDKDDKVIGDFDRSERFIYSVENGYRIKHDRSVHDVSKNSNSNPNNFFNDVERKKRECKEGEEKTINLSDEEIVEQNEEDDEFEEVLIGVGIGISVILLIIGYLLYRYRYKGKLRDIKAPIRGADTYLKPTIPGAPNVQPKGSKKLEYMILFGIVILVIGVVVYYIYTDDDDDDEEIEEERKSLAE